MAKLKGRILHCIATLEGGGAERQLCYVAEALIRDGWDVHVALLRGGANFERVKNSGAVIHQINSKSHYDPRIIFQLLKTISRVRPDIIQTWLTQMDILGGLAALIRSVPSVVSEQSSALNYAGSWKDCVRIQIGKKAGAIITNSQGGKEYWEDQTKKAELKIAVIRNIIPFEEINCDSSQEQLVLPANPKLILFAGRFSPEKNVPVLLAALNEVLKQRRDAVALLFGEGPQKSELMSLCRELECADRIGIQEFTLQLWLWLKRASVFVSISSFEGQPNTVVEAVASHCPVVISDIPAHREFLNEDSAYFTSHSSPGAVAATILEALDNPETAKRKAQSAFSSISHLSMESVSQEYQAVYFELMGGEELDRNQTFKDSIVNRDN